MKLLCCCCCCCCLTAGVQLRSVFLRCSSWLLLVVLKTDPQHYHRHLLFSSYTIFSCCSMFPPHNSGGLLRCIVITLSGPGPSNSTNHGRRSGDGLTVACDCSTHTHCRQRSAAVALHCLFREFYHFSLSYGVTDGPTSSCKEEPCATRVRPGIGRY